MNLLLTDTGAALLPKSQIVFRTSDGSLRGHLIDGLGNVFGSDEQPDALEVLRVDHLYTRAQLTIWDKYVRRLSMILGSAMATAVIERITALRN